MSTHDERLKVLQMIAKGEISSDEGARLLEALAAASAEDTPALVEPVAVENPTPQPLPPTSEEPVEKVKYAEVVEPAVERWRRWWQIPLWIGVFITVVGAAWMYSALISAGLAGLSFGFYCSMVPFFLGVAVIALAVGSRKGHWLHVRVNQSKGEHPEVVAISLPIPIRLTAWFLRHFGKYIPQMQDVKLDELLKSLDESVSPESPLFVDIDEEEGGNKVQVFIS